MMWSPVLRARAAAWLAAAVLPLALSNPPSNDSPSNDLARSGDERATAPTGAFVVRGLAERRGGPPLALGSIDGSPALGFVATADADRAPRVEPAVRVPGGIDGAAVASAPIGGALGPVFAGQRFVAFAGRPGLVRISCTLRSGALDVAVFEGDFPTGGVVEHLVWSDTALVAVLANVDGLQRIELPEIDGETRLRNVVAQPDGYLVTFTERVPAEHLAAAGRYSVRAVGRVDAAAAETRPRELAIAEVLPYGDGKGVRLVVPAVAEGDVHEIAVQIGAGERTALRRAWSTYTRRPLDRARAVTPDDPHQRRVLVFSRTTGFRHGSIPDGWRCFMELAKENAFEVRITEDPSFFTDEALAAFDAIVFLNTTGDVLDEAQQAAFQRFVEAGGGFMGVHSASDTEYEWPWYGRLVAAYFKSHPRIQDALVRVENADHPATSMLPAEWARTDEWYNFRAPPRDSVDVLLALDQDSYEGSEMPRDSGHPIAWCHTEAGGRAVYTAGGHTKAAYTEPLFRQHLFGALAWAAGWSE